MEGTAWLCFERCVLRRKEGCECSFHRGLQVRWYCSKHQLCTIVVKKLKVPRLWAPDLPKKHGRSLVDTFLARQMNLICKLRVDHQPGKCISNLMHELPSRGTLLNVEEWCQRLLRQQAFSSSFEREWMTFGLTVWELFWFTSNIMIGLYERIRFPKPVRDGRGTRLRGFWVINGSLQEKSLKFAWWIHCCIESWACGN